MTPERLEEMRLIMDEGGVSYGDAMGYVWDLLDELEKTMKILNGLSSRHEGYQFGIGPCICEWHEQARALTRKGN